MELVAAREVTWLAAQQNRGFDTFVLDPRAYVVSTDPAFAGFADSAKSYVLESHTRSHLAELAGLLRVRGIVPDSIACVVARPQGCRMGSYPGLVAMSPAIVSGDSARISVVRSEKSAGTVTGAALTTSFTTWRVTLERAGGQWVVRRVVRFP